MHTAFPVRFTAADTYDESYRGRGGCTTGIAGKTGRPTSAISTESGTCWRAICADLVKHRGFSCTPCALYTLCVYEVSHREVSDTHLCSLRPVCIRRILPGGVGIQRHLTLYCASSTCIRRILQGGVRAFVYRKRLLQPVGGPKCIPWKKAGERPHPSVRLTP